MSFLPICLQLFFCLDFPLSYPHYSNMKALGTFKGLLTSSPSRGALQHGYRPPSHSRTSFFPHLNPCTFPEADLCPQDRARLSPTAFFAAPLGPTDSFCFIYRKLAKYEKVSKIVILQSFVLEIARWQPLDRRHVLFSHTQFLKKWIDLPTKITQKSGFLACLWKNGKFWQYGTTFLPGNDEQDLRSIIRTSHVLPSSPKHYIVSHTWLTSLLLTCLAPWVFTRVPLLKAPCSPRVSGRHLRGGGFWTGPWKMDTTVVQFYFTEENLSNFIPLFWHRPCFLFLSTQQHNVSAICVLELRWFEFPFSLCHLPDAWLSKPGPVT